MTTAVRAAGTPAATASSPPSPPPSSTEPPRRPRLRRPAYEPPVVPPRWTGSLLFDERSWADHALRSDVSAAPGGTVGPGGMVGPVRTGAPWTAFDQRRAPERRGGSSAAGVLRPDDGVGPSVVPPRDGVGRSVGVGGPGATVEPDDAGRPGRMTGPAGAPAVSADVRRLATDLVRRMVEVLAGRRAPAHLACLAQPQVVRYLTASRDSGRATRQATLPQRVHVSQPTPHAAEITAVCGFGRRCRALTLRLDRDGTGWRASAVRLL